MLKTIAIGDFKTRCLRLLEEVRTSHEGLMITKRGVPIAEVFPIREKRQQARADLLGTVTFEGDIISPLGETWEASR